MTSFLSHWFTNNGPSSKTNELSDDWHMLVEVMAPDPVQAARDGEQSARIGLRPSMVVRESLTNRARFVVFAAGIASLLLLPGLLAAQKAGTIEGSVTSDSGAVVPDAAVRIVSARLLTNTDARGHFRISAIPPGSYTLVTQRLGYTADKRTVEVTAGQIARADIRLAHAPAYVAEPIIVSATRETQSRTASAATIDVLDGVEIRSARPAHPAQIMNRVPGVHITMLTGEGHSTAIRQPINTKPMYLYLEDGIPTRSTGFFNHNALYEINLPQSGGVEVFKGPPTALYGSDAIGGVVNVLTREAPAVPTVDLTAEGGAYGYGRMLATGGFTSGANGLRADANYTRTNGWQERSDYTRESATLRWDYKPSNGFSAKTVITGSKIDQAQIASLSQAQYEGRPDINPSPIGYRAVQALRLTSTVQKDQGAGLWSLTGYARHNVLDLFPTWQLTFNPQVYITKNNSAGLMGKYRRDFAPMHTRVIVGADVDVSPGSFLANGISFTRAYDTLSTAPLRVDSIWSTYKRTSTQYDYDVTYKQLSPYLHTEFSPVAKLRVDAGVRYDMNGYDYNSRLAPLDTGRNRRPASTTVSYRHATPKVGLTYDVSPALNAFASYRQGFRAPSQQQLFVQGSAVNTVDLKPVTATSSEVGIRGLLGGRVLYSVSAYDMKIKHDILTYRTPTGLQEASNAGESSHRGIEVGTGLALTPEVRVDGAFAITKQKYLEWTPQAERRDNTGKVIAPRISYDNHMIEAAPGNLANVLLTYTPSLLRGGKIAAEWSHLGKYWMDPENTQEYPGHSLLNLQVNYLWRNSELFMRAVNLTDVHYAEVAAYAASTKFQYTPGSPRMVFAGLRYNWVK